MSDRSRNGSKKAKGLAAAVSLLGASLGATIVPASAQAGDAAAAKPAGSKISYDWIKGGVAESKGEMVHYKWIKKGPDGKVTQTTYEWVKKGTPQESAPSAAATGK